MTIEPHVRHSGANAFPHPVAERAHALALRLHVAAANFHRLPEADDAWDILSACAAAPLVLSAVLNRDHLGAPADVETGDPLRPVDLVARKGQRVDAHGLQVDRNLAEGLHG